jgi:hypothetical protein
MTQADERTIDIRAILPLTIGLAGLAIGTAFGWDARLISALVTPPALIRAALVGAGVVAGIWLLRSSIERMRASRAYRAGPRAGEPDLATMVRGIRLTFLAVAAFSAAVGWLLGHPLPLVLALVIGGVDVLETSFLLLVVTFRPQR